jgi:Flp pilus assembly protein TadD
MNKPTKTHFVLAALAVVAIASAIAIRITVDKAHQRTAKAYKVYQERIALQQKATAEAIENEQRLAKLREKVANSPNDVRARWALAGELQNLRKIDDARVQLQEIVRLDPNSADAAIAFGNLNLALNRFPEAVETYRRATKRWPKNIEAWQGLAAALYKLRRFRDAGEAGRQALILDPKDRDSRLIVASSALEFGTENPNVSATRAPLNIARSLYTLLAKDDPKNGQIQYQLGLVKFLLRDKKGCLPHLQKAAELLPERSNIAADYAQILISNGKRAEARTFLTQASARMPKSAAVYFLLAESYQYDSDPQSIKTAIEACRKAVELSPNTATYWDLLGAEYLKATEIDKARQCFEKSLLLNANRSYPYQQLAGIYTRMGDTKRASIAAKMATRMTANDETMRHLEALSDQYPGAVNLILIRADRYRDLKMYGPARDLYDQALQLDSHNAEARRGIEAIDKIRAMDSPTK